MNFESASTTRQGEELVVKSLNKLKGVSLQNAIRLLLRMRLYRLCARLLYFLSEKEMKASGLNFLVIEKTGTMEDFLPVADALGKTYGGCLRISRLHLSWIANFFLSATQQDDLLPESEYSEIEHKRYKKFIKLFLLFVKDRHDLKVLIESNWIYGNSRDWHDVAEDLKIRVVILLKEGWMSLSDGESRVRRHLPVKRFQGSKILTINANETIRQISTKKVLASSLATVGSIRHDNLLRIARPSKHYQRICVLSLLIPDFRDPLNSYPRDSDRDFAEFINKLNMTVIGDVIEASTCVQNWQFVIKVKVTKFSQAKVNEIAKLQSLPDNLSFIYGGLSQEILERSDVAVSYHSTAVIDCVAMRVPVVIPSAYQNSEFKNYLQDYGNCLPTYKDSRDLMRLIRPHAAELFPSELLPTNGARDALLTRAIGNADGCSTKRAVQEIASFL